MSAPYPPPHRKLTRSTTNKLVGGVCGGVAEYLNMDANLVRILTVALTLFTGVPILLYIVALIIVPEGTRYAPPPPPVHGTQPPAAADPVWGAQGAPWEQATAPRPDTASEPQPPAQPAAADPDTERKDLR